MGDFLWEVLKVIAVPGVGGIVGLGWYGVKRASEAAAAVLALDVAITKAIAEAKAEAVKELSQFKLEVADKYAPIGYLKDVEKRITDHLVRIENKLDARTGGAGGTD